MQRERSRVRSLPASTWYSMGKAGGVNPSFWADYKNNRYATRKFASEVTSSIEVSLSRASAATYIDETGIIRTAAIDTARATYNPTTLALIGLLTESAETNESLNSETFGGTGWSSGNLASTTKAFPAPDGTNNATLMIENTGNSTHSYSAPAITIGVAYTVSIFAKNYNPGGTSKRFLAFRGMGLGANFPVFDLELGTVTNNGTSWVAGMSKITAYPNGWYRCEAVGIPTATTGPIMSLVDVSTGVSSSYTGDGVSGVYLWGANYSQNGGVSATSYIPAFGSATTRAADINPVITGMTSRTFSQIHTFTRASTKTYYGSNGLLQTAAIDAPVFSYDPATLSPIGIHIENAATNICLQSNTLSNATWAKDAITVTPNATTWVDGTTSMALITTDTSTAAHRVKELNIILTAGQVYTASSIIKRHSSYNYQLLFWNAAGSGTITVDLQNGTIQGTSGTEFVRATLRYLGNGFYRASVTIQTVSGGAYQFMNYVTNAAFSTSFTGDEVSGVYVGGCQVESGYYATSYIETTTASVTRAQDVCTNGAGNTITFASWYNTTANTILAVHLTRYTAGSALPNTTVFCINDNSASNRSMLYRNFNGAATGKMVVSSGGVDVFSQNISAASLDTTYKHAAAIAANDFALYEGGAQLGVGASGALPTSPTQLIIGHNTIAGSPLDHLGGFVAEFRAYPVRISNSELARLSI